MLYGDILFFNHRLLGALPPQVAFKERIALMLGLDHKQIFNCKARSSIARFSLVRLVSLGKVRLPILFYKEHIQGLENPGKLTAGNMHKMKVC